MGRLVLGLRITAEAWRTLLGVRGGALGVLVLVRGGGFVLVANRGARPMLLRDLDQGGSGWLPLDGLHGEVGVLEGFLQHPVGEILDRLHCIPGSLGGDQVDRERVRRHEGRPKRGVSEVVHSGQPYLHFLPCSYLREVGYLPLEGRAAKGEIGSKIFKGDDNAPPILSGGTLLQGGGKFGRLGE